MLRADLVCGVDRDRRGEVSRAGDARFLTLASPAEAEHRERASRFLAIAFPVDTEESAREWLAVRSTAYFDARHHCAAWRLRNGTWRALDAGEPSGTAGMPILAAIDARGLLDVGVVVTRYFGGTKLGAGGLARAYTEAATAALALAPTRTAIPATRMEIDYPFPLTSAVMRALERCAARDIDHGFARSGSFGRVRFTIPRDQLPLLETFLREQTSGVLAAVEVGQTVIYEP